MTEKRSVNRSDIRRRWRGAIYIKRPEMTNGCRVLLLRLSDDMGATGKVSIPRTRLAAELGVAPARITEQMKLAKRLGFIDTVRRARPGTTAVYAATVPPPPGVRPPGGDEVRPCGPDLAAEGYALPPPQEVVSAEVDSLAAGDAESDHT